MGSGGLRLKLLDSQEIRKVLPRDILDYQTFTSKHRSEADMNELRVFEKFYAARSLITEGFETFLNATLSDPDESSTIRVDTCGTKDDFLTLFYCSTGKAEESLGPFLQLVQRAQNARGVILTPLKVDLSVLGKLVPRAFDDGKVMIESLGWFGDRLDKTFQETLRLVDLLGNETRMRMLAPLFRKTAAKKEFRAMINPKLVYQNLSVLQQAGLVDEAQEGTYEISEVGKTILADFITFLEKTRRTLDTISKQKEVNING